MNKPSKSKAETLDERTQRAIAEHYTRTISEREGTECDRLRKSADIIARMEEAQQRFHSFPSLLQSAEDERREYENDLHWESLMADESEYGPVRNGRDEIGGRPTSSMLRTNPMTTDTHSDSSSASVISDSPKPHNETRGILTKVFHGGYQKRKPLAVREDSLTIALHIPGKNTIRLTLASANALANAIREAQNVTSD